MSTKKFDYDKIKKYIFFQKKIKNKLDFFTNKV